MKVVVSIVVYNRYANIELWIDCWKKADTHGAELVILHNNYGEQELINRFSKLCKDNGITYVSRKGEGFDIGCMQDVFKERLPGFPKYDLLLWACDDTLPVSKDFISPFVDAMQDPKIGISCMQISRSVDAHVRTTGFCIRYETAKLIKFPADPIKTKQHCYLLEHRGGPKTMTNQIRAMGLSAVMVSPISTSPLWDSDHPNASKRLDRAEEFNLVWNINQGDKVVFICPIFDAFPEIISSLMCQTHKNWQLLLIDDNPDKTICEAIIDAVQDERIYYIRRPRMGNYGHPHRRWALQELDKLSDADYVVISNGDNYLVPAFTASLLSGFKKNPAIKASYCENMVHSYTGWGVIPCSLKLGFIDCSGVMVRRDVAVETGWPDISGHSSDWTYFNNIISKYGAKSFVKVPGCLLIHN